MTAPKPEYHLHEVSDIAFDVEVVLTFARPLNHEEQTAALGIVEDTLAKIQRSPHLLITGQQQIMQVSEHHLRMVMRHPTILDPDYPPEQRDLDSHVHGAAVLHVFWLIIIYLSERYPVQHPFPPFWFDDPAVRQEVLDEYPLA